MRLKLRCIKACTFPYEGLRLVPDDVIMADVGKEGIRFQRRDGIYGWPYDIADVENDFVTDFDEEEYSKHFREIINIKAFDLDGNLIMETKRGTIHSE